jgi:hypothetical protein
VLRACSATSTSISTSTTVGDTRISLLSKNQRDPNVAPPPSFSWNHHPRFGAAGQRLAVRLYRRVCCAPEAGPDLRTLCSAHAVVDAAKPHHKSSTTPGAMDRAFVVRASSQPQHW